MTTKQREILELYFDHEQLNNLAKIFDLLQSEDNFELGVQTLKALNLYNPLKDLLFQYYLNMPKSDYKVLTYHLCINQKYSLDETLLRYSFMPHILKEVLRTTVATTPEFTCALYLPLFLNGLKLDAHGLIVGNPYDIDYPVVANGMIIDLPKSTIEQSFHPITAECPLEGVSHSAAILRCEKLDTRESCGVNMTSAIGCKKLYVGADSRYNFCFGEIKFPPNLEEIHIDCANLDIAHFRILFKKHKKTVAKWKKFVFTNVADASLEQYFLNKYFELYGTQMFKSTTIIFENL